MPATGYCTCCNKAFNSNLLINCSICKKSFKHSCVDLSFEELRMPSDASRLKLLILQLQSELRELKGNRTDAFPSDPLQFEEILEEVNKRNLRKSNIIIFGLDEVNQEEPPENRSARDGIAVSKVFRARFRAIDSEFDAPNIKPIRLVYNSLLQVGWSFLLEFTELDTCVDSFYAKLHNIFSDHIPKI
nr:unnamed protein product [Callosobruchus analis]